MSTTDAEPLAVLRRIQASAPTGGAAPPRSPPPSAASCAR